MKNKFRQLTKSIRQCRLCENELQHSPNPIFQIHPEARILIAGQAPGRKAHDSSIPFDDPSGDRLREWMGISREIFYDATKIAILPMSFCYPGTKKSGDLAPRPECAPAWRKNILNELPKLKLTLVIGIYAIKWHLEATAKNNLTETVKSWESYTPDIFPLPHPSPRNNIWLHKNAWYEKNVIPALRSAIANCLND